MLFPSLITLKSNKPNSITKRRTMEITDLLQPQYFPFIMIFASGYIFVYAIFGKTRAWKDFDSTIKFVLAIIAGFGLEFCIVLPLFYMNPSNIANFPIVVPAFEATWVFHWVITGGVAAIFTISARALNYGEKLVWFILLPLFGLIFYLFLILLVEYAVSYPTSVQISSPLYYYLPVNFIFSFLGVIFCIAFSVFIKRAHEDEMIYGQAGYTYVVGRSSNNERERFRRNLCSGFL